MFSDPSHYFDLTHLVVPARNLQALRLNVDLELADETNARTYRFPFRVDTGADVSIVPEPFARRLGWRLSSAQDGWRIETASGNVLTCRRATARNFRFRQLSGFWFRTDFAVSTNLSTKFGLLAWRDLAMDFWTNTLYLPQSAPGSSTLLRRGTQQFCLRTDRFPDRIGQPPS